jgi:dolichol kinase
MRESAFSTIQDLLQHCIPLLPLSLYLGGVRLEEDKQTSVLCSLLGLAAAIETYCYYRNKNAELFSSLSNIKNLICSWSLSPVLLNLVLGGHQKNSWVVLACGVLPLALPYDTLLSLVTFSVNLILLISYGLLIPVTVSVTLVILPYLVSIFFRYLTLHEKILMYSTYAFLLTDLFLEEKLTQSFASNERFSPQAYFLVCEVSLFSLSVMLCSAVGISSVVEYVSNTKDTFEKVLTRSVVSLDVILFVSLAFVIPRLTSILETNPFLWLLEVFSRDDWIAVYVSTIWILMIVVFIYFADWAMIHWNLSKNHGRKLFHALVVLMFAPVMWHETLLNFTSLSFGGACCIFVLLEYVRLYVFQGRLKAINQYFDMFISGNELQQKKRLIVSHTSLLVGCSTTIWLWTVNTQYDKILAYMGLISLGVGDAMAAVVGSLYGKKTWKQSRKTYLGSISAFISMLVFSSIIIAIDPAVSFSSWRKVIITCLVLTVAEVMLDGNDNFTLPLFSALVFMLL